MRPHDLYRLAAGDTEAALGEFVDEGLHSGLLFTRLSVQSLNAAVT